MRINAKAFGLSAGIIWGLAMAIITMISMNTGYASQFISLMSNIYPGYEANMAGVFIGGMYGFIDAFAGFYIFAWLYNKLAK